MKKLSKPALDNVMNDTVKFHPSKFKNTYKYWMEKLGMVYFKATMVGTSNTCFFLW